MDIAREVALLERMSTDQLVRKYAEVFDEATTGRNKAWLVKRIAWRLQARAEGGLSERAKKLALAMADEGDLRRTPPKAMPARGSGATAVHDLVVAPDDRLPPPGSILVRKYRGQTLRVLVRADGFEYAGEVFASLSAVAKRITGSHCNGFLFFQLNRNGGKS